MNHFTDKWRVRLSAHAAFYGYRWLSWGLGGLILTLPGRQAADLPQDAGIFLLLFVVNVALSGLARSYARLAAQRPLILALDLLFSGAVVWLSGGSALPFLPYALGALILPALLYSWRGALLSGLAFVALDMVIQALAAERPTGAAALSALTLRALAPLAFSCVWVAVAQFLPRPEPDERPGGAEPAARGSQQRQQGEAAGPGALMGLAERGAPDRGGAPFSVNAPANSPLAVARMLPAPQADPARRVIYDLTPGMEVGLPSALDQLSASVSRQGDLAVRVALVGAVQRLTQAQHSLLLRAAQEALLNVQQHARAHNAQITLTFETRAVTLVVQDDGVGLLDGTYERPGLHSLRALRYRFSELEGQLAVFESENGGVTLRATLPLE